MDGLYVDGMVYTMHWRGFMSKLLSSWRDSRLQVSIHRINGATDDIVDVGVPLSVLETEWQDQLIVQTKPLPRTLFFSPSGL